jgi:hypothetical protein
MAQSLGESSFRPAGQHHSQYLTPAPLRCGPDDPFDTLMSSCVWQRHSGRLFGPQLCCRTDRRSFRVMSEVRCGLGLSFRELVQVAHRRLLDSDVDPVGGLARVCHSPSRRPPQQRRRNERGLT